MKRRSTFHAKSVGAQDFALTLDDKPMLHYAEDGLLARIDDSARNLFDADDLLRWGAPLALAPQGIVCLHGGAVLTNIGVILILGVGGAGKSTLVDLLGRGPWIAVADDLIVCDDAGQLDLAAEEVVRSWSREVGTSDGPVSYAELGSRIEATRRDWRPCCLVVVLGERLPRALDADLVSECRNPGRQWSSNTGYSVEHTGYSVEHTGYSVERLEPIDALVEVNLHKFGGHPSPRAWAPQIRAVAAIVNRAPVIRLRVIDDLQSLESLIPDIGKVLCGIALDATKSFAAEPRQ